MRNLASAVRSRNQHSDCPRGELLKQDALRHLTAIRLRSRGRVDPPGSTSGGFSMADAFPTTGVHHITLVGSNRKDTIDFYEGVLGMPLLFEQPNLDVPEETHLYF